MKEFVTHIKEINRFQPFLPPPFNTSLKQEELFAIIKKSIPSFERLFQTNNGRTTVTNLNQLEAYYMDLKELNPPSNNQPHGRKNNCQNNVLSSHHHGHMSNNNQNIHQKSSNNQNGNNKQCHFHKSTSHSWAGCSNNANAAQQQNKSSGNPPFIKRTTKITFIKTTKIIINAGLTTLKMKNPTSQITPTV